MWIYWGFGVLGVVILALFLYVQSLKGKLDSQRERMQHTIDTNEAEFKKGITRLHTALIKTYGKHYLYEISEVPNGDYLDKNLLPRSHKSNLDRYTFFCSNSKYHYPTCRYAKMGCQENAYYILNGRNFCRCSVCHSQLPDMKWVDEYRLHYHFLNKYASARHEEGISRKFEEETKQKNQIAEDLNRLAHRRVELQKKEDFIKLTMSNLTAIPYMAGIIADFETHGIGILANDLDWGASQQRARKVLDIRRIRKEASDAIAKSKEAQYQLEYAIRMFPGLEDFLETDYRELHEIDLSEISEDGHDRTRNYLSKEEYNSLTSAERNQLALDRYRTSHRKTNWQIGRDYEYYIGYRYEKKGYDVEYFGSQNGLDDLGRDLIAKKDDRILIIQCKYWSAKKQIHEKHINQLYGTMISYCFENNLSTNQVRGVLVTNITLSDTAKRFARYLDIETREQLPLGEYPCIKCNINRDEYGLETKIYHLPFDQQYDSCKIDRPGEFFALTVAEAEAAGFRRAFRWHDN